MEPIFSIKPQRNFYSWTSQPRTKFETRWALPLLYSLLFLLPLTMSWVTLSLDDVFNDKIFNDILLKYKIVIVFLFIKKVHSIENFILEKSNMTSSINYKAFMLHVGVWIPCTVVDVSDWICVWIPIEVYVHFRVGAVKLGRVGVVVCSVCEFGGIWV